MGAGSYSRNQAKVKRGKDMDMNLLLTKRANVKRLEAELKTARSGGAGNIGQFREAQSELKREQAELARLEARLRELKEHLACLGDL